MSGTMHELERAQIVPLPLEEVFAFFADPWNLGAITPPWLRFRIEAAPPALARGALLSYRLHLFGLPVRWLTEITEWDENRCFTDVQLRGPYAHWAHTHRFAEVPGGTEVSDHVAYRMPLGVAGRVARSLAVRRWLDEIFDFRAAAIRALLA